MATAKIFRSGNSQAVRLPKEFRFADELREVSIRREGDHLVLIPLVSKEWPEDFWEAFGDVTEDFDRPPQGRQHRESLDE